MRRPYLHRQPFKKHYEDQHLANAAFGFLCMLGIIGVLMVASML